MDEIELLTQRVATLEKQIAVIPQIMALVKAQAERITAMQAKDVSGSRIPGERPDRDVDIDPHLAAQAYKAYHVYKETQKSIQIRLSIPQSKLRGVLAWPEARFFNYLGQHGLTEYYQGV